MNPIIQEISIRASAVRIFEALTNPEERAKWWWGAKGIFEITRVESDLRPGGRWTMYGLGPGGKDLKVAGEYREIDPPHLLSFTWLPDWHPNAQETLVRWDLEESGEITVVRLTHSGFTDESYRTIYRGWPQILAGLRDYLT